MQRSLLVLSVMGALSGGCSDQNDDPFEPSTNTGNNPATTPDGAAAAQPDGSVGLPVGPLDASLAPPDAAPSLIDATLNNPTPGDGGGAAERLHDTRTFTFDPTMQPSPFEPLAGIETDRWSGVLDGAGYRIEVPKDWNGILVMYAHGYGGTGSALRVTTPSIRRHLIEQKYAWAASSYTTNYYDVRAGVEDTNKLALAFNRIAADNGRPLMPTKRYIIGHSMGGHIAGAAVERENIATAKNSVNYQAALPMCGVMGDTELFNYFTAYQIAAHQLAGIPVTSMPFVDYAATRMQVQTALFTTFATATTPAGELLKNVVMNLTGGPRPVFNEGFANTGLQATVWGTFGGDGTINGILNKPVTDTRTVEYQLDADPALDDGERAFNALAYKVAPAADANPRRSDGVRWIPVVNGEFDVPVVTIHTLGDMYVPFSMQQIYRKRADAKGNADRLVQRAIRGIGHCEFTYAEQTQAFDALAKWEQQNVKPEGDNVTDRATVAAANYGCKFTTVPVAPDSDALIAGRARVACAAAPAAP
jgi:pimeloyl-ACP methyl ester carboxylesterase